MVNIYYGRAGTGKTHALENEARRLLKEGMRVFFVVPEQLTISREYSFNQTELQGVQVQSFSRLSNTVFRLLGKNGKKAAGQRDEYGCFVQISKRSIRKPVLL